MAGWTYLLVSVVGAAFTLNAWRPRAAPAWAGVVSFFAGWLTGELALHHLAWQALATWIFHLLGAFSTPPGLAGLALTAASWAGLLALYARGAHARVLIDRALDDAWGAGGPAPSPPGPEARMGRARLVLPFRMGRADVERLRDVPFSRVGGLTLKLDVYRHADRPTGCPVVLHLHGGAWVIGSKNHQGLPLMHHLAARGWVGVNANYRLSPHATFPDHLVDVKRALAWIREHADEHGVDPRFVAIAGLSAGGHLAALAALTPHEPALQPGFEEVDTAVQACVTMYGVYDVLDRDGLWPHGELRRLMERQVLKAAPDEDPARWSLASPMDQVRADAPPFLVVHGDRDSLVPVAEARRFAERLRAAGTPSPVAYAELPGAQHAFDVFHSLRASHAVEGVADFLERAWAAWREEVGDGPGLPAAEVWRRRRAREGTPPSPAAGAAPSAAGAAPTPGR